MSELKKQRKMHSHDRKFLLKLPGYQGCFCCLCGNKIMQDHYNMEKHMASCGFTMLDLREPVMSDQLGYRLRARQEGVVIEFCRPILHNGLTKKLGASWEVIAEMVFPPRGKAPIFRKNAGENLPSPEHLLHMITEKKIVRIRLEQDTFIIRKVFPQIYDIYSLEMFAAFYCAKGYSPRPGFTPAEIEELSTFRDRASLVRDLENRRSRKPVYEFYSLTTRAVTRNVNGRMVLRICYMTSDGKMEFFLLSKDGFFSSDPDPDFDRLLSVREDPVTELTTLAMKRYGRYDPASGISAYLDGIEAQKAECWNPLIPILASRYHSFLELSAKAGLAQWDYLALHDFLDQSPFLIRNLKELYGLPVSVMRKFRMFAANAGKLALIRALWEKNPGIFQNLEFYEESLYTFLKTSDYLDAKDRMNARAPRGLPRLPGTRNIAEKDLRRMIVYLNSPDFDFTMYRDYLNMSREIGTYRFGLTPKDLRLAHDDTMRMVQLRGDELLERGFLMQTGSEEYRRLSTEHATEENAVFEDDPFLIRVPDHITDLAVEGKAMHNCVATYAKQAAGGRTRILFLRRRDDPDASLGTIEVSPDGELIQAKAFANRHLPRAEQLFLRKWIAVKNLRIRSYDLCDTADSRSRRLIE